MNKSISILFYISLIITSACSEEPDYSEENVVFPNVYDGVLLSGTITYPAELRHTAPAVALIHAAGPCDRDPDAAYGSGLFRELSRFLSSKGIIVLRYDKRGVGKSGGKYNSYDINNFADDGISAVKFLEKTTRVCKENIGIIGISEGGLIAPLMQNKYLSIKFLVLMASPGTWGKDFFFESHIALCNLTDHNSVKYNLNKQLMDELWEILILPGTNNEQLNKGKNILGEMWSYMNYSERRTLGYTEANLNMWIREFTKPLLQSWYGYNQIKSLENLSCPVLAISGDKDRQTPSEFNLRFISEAIDTTLNKESEIIELKNVNHLFQNCISGMPSEYNRLGNDFSIKGFQKIAQFILKQDCR